ncbi:MAG TPA: amidohydrolase [Thermomicrobiaceae bacterium]|nr:amidohydrolase [Thermomicrobiaceae bacterium]
MRAIVNGTVYDMVGSVLRPGVVLIEGGKIVDVGERIAIPSAAEIIDAAGRVVMPGFVESHSHVGIWGDGTAWEGRDFNETSEPVTPHMRAIDGINPQDMAFRDVLAAGVTTLLTGPGSANLIGGEWAAIKPVGTIVEDMVLRYPCGLKMALGENPKRVYGDQRKSPVTRMGEAALIRESLVRAQHYAGAVERAERVGGSPPDRDLRLEPLLRALRREERTRIHAHAAQDIVTAVRLSREFGLDPVIEHATEGFRVADFLAREGVPVSVGPFHVGRPKIEMAPMTLRNPAILADAGVTVAIHMDATASTAYLPIYAGLAVREGMAEEAALKAITINAAIVSGVADRVGSLERGKDADVIILSGHPFDLMTRVEQVIIDGRTVYTLEQAA